MQDDPLHSACGKKEETPLHLLGKCCVPVLVLLWFALIQRDMVMEVDGIGWGTSVEKVFGSLSGVSRFVFIFCCTTSVLIGKRVLLLC